MMPFPSVRRHICAALQVQSVKRLSEKGAAVEYEMEVFRTVGNDSGERISPDDIILSEEQQNAYDENIFKC